MQERGRRLRIGALTVVAMSFYLGSSLSHRKGKNTGLLGYLYKRVAKLGMGAGLVLIAMLVPMHIYAQDSVRTDRTLTVGVYVNPPFVVHENEQYTGMAIELWQRLEKKVGFASTYKNYPSYRQLIAALQTGEIAAAVSNLTITRQRAQSIAFTQPWYDSGLRIMTRKKGAASLQSVLDGLVESGHLATYAWLFALALVATLGMTLLDRRLDNTFPGRWRDGLADNFFHTLSILTTGKTTHKNLFGWVGRIWSALWMVVGVAVIAYITSSITSVMTATSLTNQIHSLSDLAGKTVGVLEGSVGQDYIQGLGIPTRSYDNMDASAQGLADAEVDAIVGDAPVLEYFAHTHPNQPVRVVGNMFHPDKYGFGFPLQSELLRPVTLELLGLREAGAIRDLRVKYFGNTR